MKKCEHDLIEDECQRCLRSTIIAVEEDRAITIKVNEMLSAEIDTLRARVAELESETHEGCLMKIRELEGLLKKAHDVIRGVSNHIDRLRPDELQCSIIDRVKEAHNDRNRYRAALEKISDYYYDEPGSMRRIASEALNPTL